MTAPRDPYQWVESWAWPAIETGDVPSLAALVLLRLAAHANRDGVAWPSARKLAEMVGRSERRVRTALEQLVDLGLIDGNKEPRRVTRWRLVTDPGERDSLRHLRRICGASADPSGGEGEGEGTTGGAADVPKGRGIDSNVIYLSERRAA
jgi:hypothetical protein